MMQTNDKTAADHNRQALSAAVEALRLAPDADQSFKHLAGLLGVRQWKTVKKWVEDGHIPLKYFFAVVDVFLAHGIDLQLVHGPGERLGLAIIQYYRTKHPDLTTRPSIVDAMKMLADELGIDQWNTVYAWCQRGRISPRHYLKVVEVLAGAGVTIKNHEELLHGEYQKEAGQADSGPGRAVEA